MFTTDRPSRYPSAGRISFSSPYCTPPLSEDSTPSATLTAKIIRTPMPGAAWAKLPSAKASDRKVRAARGGIRSAADSSSDAPAS
jgi:hypothetical protein